MCTIVFGQAPEMNYHAQVNHSSDGLPILYGAVEAGLVQTSQGPHINTGQLCTLYVYPDAARVLWVPDCDEDEIVLQDGMEGEGQWFVATRESDAWTLRRDYWDRVRDESAEEVVITGDRNDVLRYLAAILLSPPTHV